MCILEKAKWSVNLFKILHLYANIYETLCAYINTQKQKQTFLQVVLFQKHLFLRQLTQNMISGFDLFRNQNTRPLSFAWAHKTKNVFIKSITFWVNWREQNYILPKRIQRSGSLWIFCWGNSSLNWIFKFRRSFFF